MARLVMKFGGTSVADIERIRNVARHVKREVDAGHEVAVVVSAMSGTTNELVAWCREAAALHDAARIRRRGRLRRAGHRRPAGHRAAGDGRHRALLAGLAGADPDLRRARLGAHRRHRRRRADQALQGARRGRGDRRLPGRCTRRPAASPRSAAAAPTPRRSRSPPRSRPTAATSTPTSTASTPPIRASCRKARRLDKISFEEMLEMASLGAKVLQVRSVELAMVHRVRDLRALELRRARGHRCARHAAGHADLRRGGDRGKADRHRHRLRQGRGPDLDPPRRRQAGRRRRDLRAAGRRQHQCRHDRAERLGRRRHHRHDLHGAGGRLRARQGDHRQAPRRGSASSASTARPTSPRSR